jgi:hypothetical protein
VSASIPFRFKRFTGGTLGATVSSRAITLRQAISGKRKQRSRQAHSGVRSEAGMMDRKVVETALRDASCIVADYFRSEPRDVDKTIVKLSEVLDNHKLAAAVQRLEL